MKSRKTMTKVIAGMIIGTMVVSSYNVAFAQGIGNGSMTGNQTSRFGRTNNPGANMQQQQATQNNQTTQLIEQGLMFRLNNLVQAGVITEKQKSAIVSYIEQKGAKTKTSESSIWSELVTQGIITQDQADKIISSANSQIKSSSNTTESSSNSLHQNPKFNIKEYNNGDFNFKPDRLEKNTTSQGISMDKDKQDIPKFDPMKQDITDMPDLTPMDKKPPMFNTTAQSIDMTNTTTQSININDKLDELVASGVISEEQKTEIINCMDENKSETNIEQLLIDKEIITKDQAEAIKELFTKRKEQFLDRKLDENVISNAESINDGYNEYHVNSDN